MDEYAITQELQQLSRQMGELTRTTVFWMVVSALLLIMTVCVLVMLVRMRRRNRKVEAWLVREMTAVREGQANIQRIFTAPAPQRQAQQPIPAIRQPVHAVPQGKAPRVTPAQTAAVAPAPRTEEIPQTPPQPLDLMSTLNEMLLGNQPYNFIESVRILSPGLTLQRLTPIQSDDVFRKEVVLRLGGDGLFAVIDGNSATLYPNYSKFSATLDPKPLFEGARHGARIHSILAPATLTRQADDTWILTQRGKVQMRQGAQ